MEQIIYQWREGAPIHADPQVVGECIRELGQRLGRPFEMVTADDLVEAARDPNHPLHAHFQWDNGIAAANWRRQQARLVLGGLRYTVVRGATTQQVALGSVKVNEQRGYVEVTLIEHNYELSCQMRESVLAGLRAWQKRAAQFVTGRAWSLIDEGANELEAVVAAEQEAAQAAEADQPEAVADAPPPALPARRRGRPRKQPVAAD